MITTSRQPGVITLLATLFLCSCASPPAGVALDAPRPRPGLILVTPDQALKHGIAWGASAAAVPGPAREPGDHAGVLVAPEIKAYTVARYVDPADPDLLHEAHVVYRRESSGGWRLDAPTSAAVPAAPAESKKPDESKP